MHDLPTSLFSKAQLHSWILHFSPCSGTGGQGVEGCIQLPCLCRGGWLTLFPWSRGGSPAQESVLCELLQHESFPWAAAPPALLHEVPPMELSLSGTGCSSWGPASQPAPAGASPCTGPARTLPRAPLTPEGEKHVQCQPELLWPWHQTVISVFFFMRVLLFLSVLFPFEDKSPRKNLQWKTLLNGLERQKLCKTHASYSCRDKSGENLILELICIEVWARWYRRMTCMETHFYFVALIFICSLVECKPKDPLLYVVQDAHDKSELVLRE